MSADAWVKQTADGWLGDHDGPCALPGAVPTASGRHTGTAYDLVVVLLGLEACLTAGRGSLNWQMETLENGELRLRGWAAR